MFFSFQEKKFLLYLQLLSDPTTMTSKRKLKKQINDICSILLAECFAKLIECENSNEENIDAILKSIMTMNDDYTRRISHVEPGMKPNEYFKDLINSFNTHVDEIIDNITSIN